MNKMLDVFKKALIESIKCTLFVIVCGGVGYSFIYLIFKLSNNGIVPTYIVTLICLFVFLFLLNLLRIFLGED